VPMYFLIGIWGHGPAHLLCSPSFSYTRWPARFLMLVGIIYLYNRAGSTFDYQGILAALQNGRLNLSATEQYWLFLAFLRRICDQVPLFSAAYMAARRARRGADSGLRYARLRHAENGHLRAAAILRPDVPVGGARECSLDHRASRSSVSSYGAARRDGAAEHEEAGGVLVG